MYAMSEFKVYGVCFMKHEHIVKSVEPGSIADELGIEAGDKLISINHNIIEDVFDYHFYVNVEQFYQVKIIKLRLE